MSFKEEIELLKQQLAKLEEKAGLKEEESAEIDFMNGCYGSDLDKWNSLPKSWRLMTPAEFYKTWQKEWPTDPRLIEFQKSGKAIVNPPQEVEKKKNYRTGRPRGSQWDKWTKHSDVVAWFVENEIDAMERRKSTREIAVSYAKSVGLLSISEEIERSMEPTERTKESNSFYLRFRIVLNEMAENKILFKEVINFARFIDMEEGKAQGTRVRKTLPGKKAYFHLIRGIE